MSTIIIKESDISCNTGRQINTFLARESHQAIRALRAEIKKAGSKVGLWNMTLMYTETSMIGNIRHLPVFIAHIKTCTVRVEKIIEGSGLGSEEFNIWEIAKTENSKVHDISTAIKGFLDHLEYLVDKYK